MAKRGTRDLAKETRWRQAIAAQQRSGQTVRQYCRENHLRESAFWFWKRELTKRDAAKPAGTPSSQSSARTPQRRRPAQSLIPVTIGPTLGSMAPIEVLLSGGVSVRVAAGCDEATLRMVLSALESRS